MHLSGNPMDGTALDGPSTGEQIKDENNNREYEQDVDPAAKRVAAYEANGPQNDEQNSDSPKHQVLLGM